MLGPRSRSEIDFLENKKSENRVNTETPPPFSHLRDIVVQKLLASEKKAKKLPNTICDAFFLPPPSFLGHIDKHKNWHKIITRGRIDILRPDFESP